MTPAGSLAATKASNTPAPLGDASPDLDMKEEKSHQCHANHTGSSKSMEGANSAQIVKQLCQAKSYVGAVIGDGDSNSTHQIQLQVPEPFNTPKKQLDINHGTKGWLLICRIELSFTYLSTGFRKGLYEIEPPLPDCSIRKLTSDWRMAIEQNRGDVDAISKALGNIVNHRYDLDHSRCPSWCNRKTPSHVIKVAKEQVAQYIQRYQEQKFLTRIKDAHNSQAAESFFSRLVHFRTKATLSVSQEPGLGELHELSCENES